MAKCKQSWVFLPVLFICLILVAAALRNWVPNILKAQQTKTKLIPRTARGLLGKYQKHELGEFEETVEADAWGCPMKATAFVDEYSETVVVVSAGADGAFNTKDDIEGSATNVHHRELIGKFVGESTVKVGRGFLRGVRDEFRSRNKKGNQ